MIETTPTQNPNNKSTVLQLLYWNNFPLLCYFAYNVAVFYIYITPIGAFAFVQLMIDVIDPKHVLCNEMGIYYFQEQSIVLLVVEGTSRHVSARPYS